MSIALRTALWAPMFLTSIVVAAAPEPGPATTVPSWTPPPIPRHHAHIGLCLIAYGGNPMGPFEADRLKRDVDLVISGPAVAPLVHKLSPRTPVLIYSNVSNIYEDLLLEYLAYADAHRLDRESGFYHVAAPTEYRGEAGSTHPVRQFWSVLASERGGPFRYLTGAAGAGDGRTFSLTEDGGAICFGYPERFGQIDIDVETRPGAGWSYALDYTVATQPGSPSRWSPLRNIKTASKERTFELTFDPPRDWAPATLHGGARLFYVRLRETRHGRPPVVTSIHAADYTGAGNGGNGRIPVFDFAADADHDGYLNDAEFAQRKSGCEARFAYQSRLCTQYGQMRFCSRPDSPVLRSWAVAHHHDLLAKHPGAAGVFMDNNGWVAPWRPERLHLVEDPGTFPTAMGALVGEVGKQIAPRFVVGNTGGNPPSYDPIIQGNPLYFDEFLIQPMAHTFPQFEETAAVVARHAALTIPPPLAILDSRPQGGEMTDPRMQIAVLAYYYLLADPKATMLCLWGGDDPGGPWSRHWFKALSHDVGRPKGPFTELAKGHDPAAAEHEFRVYKREYETALVLYKPLSFGGEDREPGTTGDASATTHDLDGNYRPLRADGSMGSPTRSVKLRNGEGAILLPTSAAPAQATRLKPGIRRPT